ncbi:MAG: protease [Thermobacillus sp. ZCTH02-B1]|uniref:NfeD family protein n=1 Tax=Thermobacillus sp. ZCTH02-B1 TaxID=1858795 RepID=UPI000B5614AD|nr:NfeD family protein [Thermobacillus sp. ZCTH02-B1]OUM93844.1 MAG: protease [Thermobacillus sp. ZCTH02-B1]
MEALYWACLTIGILYAAVTIVFGDMLGDLLDGALGFLADGPDWLHPTTIVGGVTVFGGAGILLGRYTDLGAGGVAALALLAAVVIGAGVYFFYVRPMRSSESSTGYSLEEMAGKIAEVLVPIPADGYGEVMLRMGAAGVTNRTAASFDGEPVEAGAQVVVVEVKDGTLYVSRLDSDFAGNLTLKGDRT